MKKTAVEWLVKELNKMIDFIPMDKWDEIRDIVQQAKEMEMQQIMDAVNFGNAYNGWALKHEFKKYYNETFKKETK